jgi:hypothetical protein
LRASVGSTEVSAAGDALAEVGAILFRAPKGRIGGHCDSGGEADGSPLSWPSDPGDRRHPARLVAVLETNAIGCACLRDR